MLLDQDGGRGGGGGENGPEKKGGGGSVALKVYFADGIGTEMELDWSPNGSFEDGGGIVC